MQLLRNFDDVFTFLREGNAGKMRVAVVCPHDTHSLEAVEGALKRDICEFVFVGNADCPEAAALCDRYAGRIRFVEEVDKDEAARHAVRMVREGEADVLMKGLVNTENLLRALLNKQEGILEEGRVMTHITAAEIEGMDRLLMFSDAAVIPNPSLEQLSAIVDYLGQVGHSFGKECPRVALIHCNEKTSPKFEVTLWYKEIKERAARGDYGNMIVDGPMDVKTALDCHSAEVKGIVSDVVGHADALVFPDIEAGNVFYKTISYFAHSVNAGMLMGAKAPVVLPSRSDSSKSKLCSIALACLYASISNKC